MTKYIPEELEEGAAYFAAQFEVTGSMVGGKERRQEDGPERSLVFVIRKQRKEYWRPVCPSFLWPSYQAMIWSSLRQLNLSRNTFLDVPTSVIPILVQMIMLSD